MSSWSNRFVSVSALALLAACHSAPPRASSAPAEIQAPPSAKGGATSAAGDMAGVDDTAVPQRAAQQYAQAVQLMKSGRDTDAERDFKELAVGYPELAGPQLNLGLLYVRDSRLPEAEAAFKTALEHSPNNAVAGNELGIVERKLGKFAEAEAAYQRTIAADPNYAPAHMNLGILYDLYLAEPKKALGEFERYVEIAGENKQVAGWLVELRKRAGVPAPAPTSAAGVDCNAAIRDLAATAPSTPGSGPASTPAPSAPPAAGPAATPAPSATPAAGPAATPAPAPIRAAPPATAPRTALKEAA